MHRPSTSWIGLFALHLACGAPAELDKDLFPPPSETGYIDNQIGAAGSTGGNANGGSSGAGGTTAAGAGGGSGGASSNVPPANGGTNSTSPAGGASGSSGGGCPADVTTLFNRPASQGGCADKGCHVASGGIAPDLVSPGVLQRLLNVPSTCQGRPYIGADADDSFLANKIAAEPTACGASMPFFQQASLSDADEQCILDWIDQVGGGG
jgi:hypothetical protein